MEMCNLGSRKHGERGSSYQARQFGQPALRIGDFAQPTFDRRELAQRCPSILVFPATAINQHRYRGDAGGKDRAENHPTRSLGRIGNGGGHRDVVQLIDQFRQRETVEFVHGKRRAD